MMQVVVIVLLGVHLAYSGKHSLKYFYTGVSGDIDFPEFTTVGLVDEVPFMYFDSNAMKAVPKTEWMRQKEGADYWDRETQILIDTHQTFKNNIQIAKQRFNQSKGVHTVQEMYGCEWDDQTGATDAFLQFGYDGEDFLSLDLKEMRWISPVQQGIITVQKWNNDRGYIESDRNYLSTVCIEWLQKYVQYGKSSLQRKVSPQVSLLQKSSSSSVTCHATGFYPSGVTISWMKNGRDHDEDVDLGELLPNEDGTFQKTSTIRVSPEEWKNNKFSCVVEHQGETKDKIRTKYGKHSLKYFYTGVSGDIDFPEFTTVGLVDEVPFMYFDSNAMKAVPKTEWMRQKEGADYWDRETQILIDTHQTFKNNIQIAKQRFNQSKGVHTVQEMYGCEWDDQTGATEAFLQFGYDGEDFLSLDLKEMRWISPVQQGIITVQKWNNDRGYIESDRNYLSTVCIEWLQKYVQYGKSSLQRKVSPQVSLLQKSSSSSVTCHATGFYPSGVTISWMKNGRDHDEDVDLGELLPNEDGTFQKTSTIRVSPEEWKNNKFSCVVQHQGETKTVDKIRAKYVKGAPAA
ncbi:uncharacterized protein LOC143701629 isoform X2 [Siphateles boraxobius]|uniref:uncharacterized protein LOC143701629 isoform X2 n=1 Tax=Siphateles boraxobius TaxID=180520 RepID=UPI0040644C45